MRGGQPIKGGMSLPLTRLASLTAALKICHNLQMFMWKGADDRPDSTRLVNTRNLEEDRKVGKWLPVIHSGTGRLGEHVKHNIHSRR
jgi:hypothetical protein